MKESIASENIYWAKRPEVVERLRQAAEVGDAVEVGELVDELRFGFYLRYDDIYRLVEDIMEPAEWDSLMDEWATC